jgi:hypothetical protein
MNTIEFHIPTNRKLAFLIGTLNSLQESAFHASHKANVRILYNGSDENWLLEDSIYENLDISIIHTRVNALSSARNSGLNASQCEWIASLDDDVTCSIQYVSAALKVVESLDYKSAVAGRINLQKQNLMPNWMGNMTQALMCNFDLGNKSHRINHAGVGANFIVNRKFAMEIGGYNEQLGRMGKLLLSNEDYDYFQRHLQEGGQIYYSAELAVEHDFHSDRATTNWMLERMAWQGISDAVMGNEVSYKKLFESLQRTGIPNLSQSFMSLLKPASEAHEFEKRLIAIRNLVTCLATITGQEIDLASQYFVQNENEHKNYIWNNSFDLAKVATCETLFIDFAGNHPGNYEYVYSKLTNNHIIRTVTNPWVNPRETADELKYFISTANLMDIKAIVFLTADAIFWNHPLFAFLNDSKQLEHVKRIGYIHRANSEIAQGVVALHKFFHAIVMYGEAGANVLSKRWNVEIISSPCPSFVESHFNRNLKEHVKKDGSSIFGLIGEFRREKNYKNFFEYLKSLNQEDKSKVEIVLFGRDKDGSKQVIIELIKLYGIKFQVLDKGSNLINSMDRNYFAALNKIDVLVGGYADYQEIAASGPVVEAVTLNKKIFIDESSWIGRDLLKYSRDSIFGLTSHGGLSDRTKLVSSEKALKLLSTLVKN